MNTMTITIEKRLINASFEQLQAAMPKGTKVFADSFKFEVQANLANMTKIAKALAKLGVEV